MWRIRDSIRNLTAARSARVSYITEPIDWVVTQVGTNIARALRRSHGLHMHVTTSTHGLTQPVIHFGSLPAFLTLTHARRTAAVSRRVLTIYHVSPAFRQLEQLREATAGLTAIHTTNEQTRQELLKLRLPPALVHVIPLGVNQNVFHPPLGNERAQLRRQLGIPDDAFVIGSFQKDGVGWHDGARPKLIKGPDVLCHTLARMVTRRVFALLTGPARGYVTQELKRHRVPHHNLGFLPAASDVAPLYRALDAYLIASRVEGGPQQLLEAWASGVPVVSTPVGMVPDVARHERDVLLAPIGDSSRLAGELSRLASQPLLREQLRRGAWQTVAHLTWENIARRYLAEFYQPWL